MPATDRALALLLAGLTLATRIPFRARLLPTWDAVQFALALSDYDIVKHQPHPPGYILYVGLARLLAVLTGDPAAALTWLAVGASAVAVVLVYRLAWILHGRTAALIAALGLLTSPLFWFYGLVALPYTTEAALATAVASLVWTMRAGRPAFALWSTLALGLAGGVRQSLLLLLLPLWLAMAWAGLRRWRPILAGLAVLAVTTLAWLVPMLALTGGPGRYLQASAELYGSTVRAATVLGAPGGWLTNMRGLVEAALMGLGLWLVVVGWRLARAVTRPAMDGARAAFFAAWLGPPLAVYTLVHFGQYGYLLSVLPAVYVMLAGAARACRPAVGAALLGGIALAHAGYFLAARPVDVPSLPATAATAERWTAWAREVYRYRFWALTAGGLREQESVIAAYRDAVRTFPPATTVLVTELGNPRSYPWFRHATYYLAEFAVVHLRLGGFSPGYLMGPGVRTMAAVPRTDVPLPARAQQLVWVVDFWHPGLPRPSGLREQPVPYGRWLYVLDLDGRPVVHAGYRLVPAPG